MNLRKALALFAIYCAGLLCSASAYAFPSVLDQWRLRYATSNSDEVQCQLCHQSSGGGDPWNAYGNSLNERITNAFNNTQVQIALAQVEDEDADGDGISNLDEINDGFQPGWTIGNGNQLFDRDTNQINGTVAAPDLIDVAALDHPDEITNPLPDIQTGTINLSLFEVADGFSRPVKAVTAPGINGSIFVVEQAGRIIRVDLTSREKTEFLDTQSSIFADANEAGLLGLAFHPNFENNGLLYTYQSERTADHPNTDFSLASRNHVSVIVEYRVNDPSCNSTPIRLREILTVDQPRGNHNAGDVAFGPDGMLYIALGDGGGASDEGTGNDPIGNGRDNTTILGSVLRIDVNGNNSTNGQYGIPSDNPFIANNDPGLDEIFAYGFRNPFRFSFDAVTGELYLGDVGQDDIEEVNIVNSGENYGWNWKEGSFFFYDTNAPPNRYVSDVAPPGVPDDLVDPIAEYDQDDGVSVIGGFVYRGSQVPLLSGRYVFGEFLSRLFYLDGNNTVLEFPNLSVTSSVIGFGQDVDNEIYVLNSSGQLLKLQAPGSAYSPPNNNGEDAQCPAVEGGELCFPIVAENGNIASVCL